MHPIKENHFRSFANFLLYFFSIHFIFIQSFRQECPSVANPPHHGSRQIPMKKSLDV